MARTDSFRQQHAALQQLLRGVTYALVFLMPFSVFFAIGPPWDQNVLALYAQRGFYLSDLPLAILLVLTLLGSLPWRRGPLLVTISLVAICVLAFVSVPRAVSPSFAFYVAVRWLLALYLYLWFLQPVVPIRRLAAALALTLSLHAIVGIAQVLIQGPLNLPGELTLPPDIPGAAVINVDGVSWLRAYGLAFHPNVLGGFLAAGLLLLVPWLERLPAIGLWWLLWSGLLVTFSRAAWLGVALTLPPAILYFYIRRPRARLAVALTTFGALAVSLAFLFLAGEQFSTRLSPLVNLDPAGEDVSPAPGGVSPPPAEVSPPPETELFSLSERAALNELAWEVVAQRPFGGIGAGNFPLAVPRLRPLMRAQSVHNVPLLLAAEVGIGGGALWLLMSIAVAARFVYHRRRTSPWLFSAICAWLALVVISLFDSYPWSLNSGLLLTVMVLGLASRAPRDSG